MYAKNFWKSSSWTLANVRKAEPIRQWEQLGKQKMVMYGFMEIVILAVVFTGSHYTSSLFEFYHYCFMWMGLEPFINFVMLLLAYYAYEDCYEVDTSSASDVHCLGGSDDKYGKFGSLIRGGHDEYRNVLFFINLGNEIGTGIIHAILVTEEYYY